MSGAAGWGFAEPGRLAAALGYYRHLLADGGNEERQAVYRAKVSVPTLIIHGEADWIIPVGDAQALHAGCGAADRRLVTVPGAGHNDLLWVGQQEYFEAIREFVAG